MIENGYTEKPSNVENVDGCVLDKSLSGKRAQVYYHPRTKHLVVNHRGTKDMQDVMTDIGLMFGHKSGKRFQHGKKITDEAIKKYNTDNVSKIAKEANRPHRKETIAINPAYLPEDMLENQKDNEIVIRSTLDPISALHNFNPF